jgi:predicted metal-dependent phosphotriesterase family hydrolase
MPFSSVMKESKINVVTTGGIYQRAIISQHLHSSGILPTID